MWRNGVPEPPRNSSNHNLPHIQCCANIERLATLKKPKPPVNPNSLELRFFNSLSSKLTPLYNTSLIVIEDKIAINNVETAIQRIADHLKLQATLFRQKTRPPTKTPLHTSSAVHVSSQNWCQGTSRLTQCEVALRLCIL